MRRAFLCCGFVFAVAAALSADANLRIEDAGLHGYWGAPEPVRVMIRNPSSQRRVIHLHVEASNQSGDASSVTSDFRLNGGEERRMVLPMVISAGQNELTATAISDGATVGHDSFEVQFSQQKLIVLMCANEDLCKALQSQIQFSGNIDQRADKNRQLKFESVEDEREQWWSYSAAGAIVLARPVANFSPAQRNALEEYLRCGGRLILMENEIADPAFLAAYRTTAPPPGGERVGKGRLFRVAGAGANTLGDFFSGNNWPAIAGAEYTQWSNQNRTDLLTRKFAAMFSFPRLRWMLLWLGGYILMIGVVNFAVLRRLRRLDYGWISVCVIALLFATGFYFSSSKDRPKEFRFDNLATYYMDGKSAMAAADYDLRISAPSRHDLTVSIADPAVFTFTNAVNSETNSQIWSEMNRQTTQTRQGYDVRLGPPTQVDLSLLKWSFRDLALKGLHEFPGTVHFVAPNRLRNDTGQSFSDAIYVDSDADALYSLPAMVAGQEVSLDSLTHESMISKQGQWYPGRRVEDYRKQTLAEAGRNGLWTIPRQGKTFVGLSEGPALSVDVNIAHQQNAHSLIIVGLGQP